VAVLVANGDVVGAAVEWRRCNFDNAVINGIDLSAKWSNQIASSVAPSITSRSSEPASADVITEARN
jgi:hypothetical protein